VRLACRPRKAGASERASGMSCPGGIKNGNRRQCEVAVTQCRPSSAKSHTLMAGTTKAAALYRHHVRQLLTVTSFLRGGKLPNHDDAVSTRLEGGASTGCATLHDRCQSRQQQSKRYENQPVVGTKPAQTDRMAATSASGGHDGESHRSPRRNRTGKPLACTERAIRMLCYRMGR